ncbi:HNH endonuclease [Arthrobacter subterraneus]|uniref:HNH endonuclease n=1 Tax=Arthrobacter subterraneus TaxID=335973 RepID=A0A1G8FNM5_9MICC|nr:HNH endonuclease signature motif containing protein [Arthrobacter subterraneus]SDH83745.1 HNH endonuclease [Arthrobacter subterraneus]
MRFSEQQFGSGAGAPAADVADEGARLGLTSVWEGSADPAASGPRGRVQLPPVDSFDLPHAVEALALVSELQSWAEAQKAKLVNRIREHYRLKSLYRNDDAAVAEEESSLWAAEEIGAVLRLPARTARTLVEQSERLIHAYPRTFLGLESGRLSWRHATTVVEECVGVPADSVAQFEQELVETAERSTVPKLTRHARGLRELLHSDAAPIRTTRATADRRVLLEPAPDGMAWLSAYLPAEQACGIYNRLDAGARGLQTPDEPRTLTQLRADVLTDLLTHTCAGNIDTGTGYRGINATVHLTVPALTLLNQLPGAEDAPLSDTSPEARGYPPAQGPRSYPVLEGYGPIDPDTAARLAAHAPSFTRILTHPHTGAALSIGRATYRPPKHLQDWVRIRDKTCRHPGCNRAAVATEIDHTIPWHHGGRTNHDNLACLCAKHHRLKTIGLWDYMQPEPGTITATSPAGKTYTTQPPPF